MLSKCFSYIPYVFYSIPFVFRVFTMFLLYIFHVFSLYIPCLFHSFPWCVFPACVSVLYSPCFPPRFHVHIQLYSMMCFPVFIVFNVVSTVFHNVFSRYSLFFYYIPCFFQVIPIFLLYSLCFVYCIQCGLTSTPSPEVHEMAKACIVALVWKITSFGGTYRLVLAGLCMTVMTNVLKTLEILSLLDKVVFNISHKQHAIQHLALLPPFHATPARTSLSARRLFWNKM